MWGWISRPGKKGFGEALPKRVRGVQTLWGREFTLVKDGLEEAQVVAYVEELTSRYNSVVERLENPPSPSELAAKVILEAEQMAESIREDERKQAAEQAAKIIYQAEERFEQIVEEAERAATHRLQEATRLSAEIIGKAREKTTLAEESTIQQLPQQLANIQSALQTAIDQAYQKVLSDLIDLERDIQSKGTEEESQPTEALQADEALVVSPPEAMEEEPQSAEAFHTEEAPVETIPEVIEDEPEISGGPHLQLDPGCS